MRNKEERERVPGGGQHKVHSTQLDVGFVQNVVDSQALALGQHIARCARLHALGHHHEHALEGLDLVMSLVVIVPVEAEKEGQVLLLSQLEVLLHILNGNGLIDLKR
jgi:hypothetical protein